MKTPIQKGTYAETIIAADLIERGFSVSKPISHDTRYDLIAEKNGNFYRVQCKYNGEAFDGFAKVKTSRTGLHSHTIYTQKDFEWLASYNAPNKTIYYIPSSVLGDKGRRHFSIRLSPTKNLQKTGVNHAVDFLEPPVIQNSTRS